ncbi:MAG: LD-carboxypeptidase [Polyangiaceae bacterium]|nr:LD-carboxypeptidase [Polyangiaceae bacterium]
MQRPSPLRPGARVRAIAPSGPFDHTLVWRGLAALAERYQVSYSREMFRRAGYLAGDDARRAAELQAALDDASLAAVVAARGGYGLSRIASRIDWSALARHPKWLVGFSDITVLHLEAARVGVASLHAHNVAGLGRYGAERHAEWFAALEGALTQRHALVPVHVGDAALQGRAVGPLAGGNLTLVATHSAARRLALPRGCILVLEEIAEAPYRVDRALTALLESGDLQGVSGVVLGDFIGCSPGRYGVEVEAVLAERLAELEVPVARGLPIGHGEPNRPLPLGLEATLRVDASGASLSIA